MPRQAGLCLLKEMENLRGTDSGVQQTLIHSTRLRCDGDGDRSVYLAQTRIARVRNTTTRHIHQAPNQTPSFS